MNILFINHFARSYREKNVKARPGFRFALLHIALYQSVSDYDDVFWL